MRYLVRITLCLLDFVRFVLLPDFADESCFVYKVRYSKMYQKPICSYCEIMDTEQSKSTEEASSKLVCHHILLDIV